jgi:cell division protein FtsL
MRVRLASVAIGLCLLGPVVAGLFKVWVYQDAIQLGYRLSEREEERRRLRNDVRQLELELASERAPARLLQLATRLGLAAPTPAQIFDAGEGRRASPARKGGVRGTP